MYAKILICNRSLEYFKVLLMAVVGGGEIFDRYQLNAVARFLYLYLWPK